MFSFAHMLCFDKRSGWVAKRKDRHRVFPLFWLKSWIKQWNLREKFTIDQFIGISIQSYRISLKVSLGHQKESWCETSLLIIVMSAVVTFLSQRGENCLKKIQKRSSHPHKNIYIYIYSGSVRKTQLAEVCVSICSWTICPSSHHLWCPKKCTTTT